MNSPRKPTSSMTQGQANLCLMDLYCWVMALRISGGPGVTVKNTTKGITISAPSKPTKTSPSSTTAAATVYPFAITDATNRTAPTTPVAKASVGWGTVGLQIPTMDATSLSADPLHTFSSAGTYLGYLEYTGSAATVNWTTGSVPTDDATHTYLIIGQVTVAVEASGFAVTNVRQNVFNSFLCDYCGSSLWRWIGLGSI